MFDKLQIWGVVAWHKFFPVVLDGKVKTTISVSDPYPHPTETSIVNTKNTQN